MLIDTGAVPSVINAKLAERLRLYGVSQKFSVMNRSINVTRMRVPKIRLGAVGVEVLDMVAMDLGGIERALGISVDAVIGLDLLGRHNFTIDYRRRKILFCASSRPSGAIAFEMKHESGGTYILLPLMSGGEEFEMLLDTGTKDLMLFGPRLRGGLQRLRVRGQDFNVNAGGRDRLAVVELESVRVGPLVRRKQHAYVWGTPENELRSFDGRLGPAAFGVTAVGFDFDRRLISFEIR
jgi:predicted aspartyl protease